MLKKKERERKNRRSLSIQFNHRMCLKPEVYSPITQKKTKILKNLFSLILNRNHKEKIILIK